MGLNRGFFYVWMANNLSQSWAIYCLVMLYRVTHDDLQRIKPLLKFIYIKAVVFFSFWQAVALALIIKFKLLRPFCSGTICISSTYALEATIVDVVICVEMFMCVGLPLRPSFVFSSPPRRGPLGRGRLRSVDRSMAIVRARRLRGVSLLSLSLSLPFSLYSTLPLVYYLLPAPLQLRSCESLRLLVQALFPRRGSRNRSVLGRLRRAGEWRWRRSPGRQK